MDVIERSREVILLEKQVEDMQRRKEEQEKENETEEYKIKRVKEKELLRRNTVFSFYKDFTGNKMSKEQYLKYISIFESEDTSDGYNLKTFILNNDNKQE